MKIGLFSWTSDRSSTSCGCEAVDRTYAPFNRSILVMALVSVLGLGGLALLNRSYAPEMYSSSGPKLIADALAADSNYAVFDLNLNIRAIRDAHIAAMPKAPKFAILGASHWQEAHSDILPREASYNAHVHRDYYEDMLAVVEMFVRHNKLPQSLVISIRDNLFTPIALRRDFLWLPGIPQYRRMASHLGLTTHDAYATLPVQRWREQISLPMLFDNVTRWYNAAERPHMTTLRYFRSMDTLLPDGSIVWSREHRSAFTQDRSMTLARAHAKDLANRPPVIDPKGVEAIDALLSFLVARGIEVTLAHPPFNPMFFELVRNTPYRAGLSRVEALTASLAEKHNLRVIGSFDPTPLGCTSEMYIDAEHANPECLHRIFEQLNPTNDRLPVARVAELTSHDFDMDRTQTGPWLRTSTSSQELASQLQAIQANAFSLPGRTQSSQPQSNLESTIVAGASRPQQEAALSEPMPHRRPNAIEAPERKGADVQKKSLVKPLRRTVKRRSVRRVKPTLIWPGDTAAARGFSSGRSHRANTVNG